MAYIEKEPLCAWLENMGVSDIIIRRIKSEAYFPTADVVEVVRCGECKHCELRYPAKAIGEEAIEGYYCYQNQRYVKSTGFCSGGERRTDNDL